MVPALAFIVSFLKFAAETAPEIVTDIRKLVGAWATKKGIPHEQILPALADVLDDKVKAVDEAVDRQIAAFWGDEPTKPGVKKS